jgi:serine/threonine protein kinase
LDQIGKYRILGKIGQGAMGEVFRAHDDVLNRPVAIKTISADLGGDDTLRKRFEREAQSAARLNHPNIITVFDYGEEQNKIYMSMELLEGQDLKRALAQGLVQGLDKKLDIMEQICDGLAFAHAADIVHRDLKPANIHMLPSGQIKIMDFGLARLGTSEMTRTGMVMGTPHYMSPEQVRGERADARSDVFSLGCLFYELLTYRKPFDADSMHGVLFKVMQEEPPSVLEIAPDTPVAVAQILDRALSKDPAERYQNASELRAAVRRARQAVGEGRGHEVLAEQRDPGTGTPPPRQVRGTPGDASRPSMPSLRSGSSMKAVPPAARSQVGSPAGSGAALRSGSRPPVRRSPWPLIAGGAALALAVVIGAWLTLRQPAPARPVTSTAVTPAPVVNELSRTLAADQAELAKKRLQAGDYNEAFRLADRALKLDAGNAEAQDVLQKARAVRDEADAAASTGKRNLAAGNKPGAAESLWSLLLLAPEHPAAAELVAALEAELKPRSEEARRRATDARAAAEKGNATTLEAFKDGVGLAREGEAAAKAGRFATATRKYLEARESFEKARQSLK